jgi:hypothetical protein
LNKSKRPPEPEGPDRLAMSRADVERLVRDRFNLGHTLQQQYQMHQRGIEAWAPYDRLERFLADLQGWSSATETALDNLFTGSKTLRTYQQAGRLGIGIIHDRLQEQVDDALERHRRRLHALEAIIAGLPYMQEATSHPHQPTHQPQPVWHTRDVTINLQSGNVNLGTLVGDVTSNVSGLSGPGADVLKQLMEELAAAVVDAHLPHEIKAEAVEAVEQLSEGLKAGPDHKPSAMLRAAMRHLPGLLQTADIALRVWSQVQAQVGPYLPPGTV